MGRDADLSTIRGYSDISFIDLTPNGVIATTGAGPICYNPFPIANVQLEQRAGSDAMTVRLQGSNAQVLWEDIDTASSLTASGASWSTLIYHGFPFLRLYVDSVGTGGQVSGTAVRRS